MTVTITIWWLLPLIITVLAILWAFFWPADDSGTFGGITRLLMLTPALVVSMVAWIVAAFLK